MEAIFPIIFVISLFDNFAIETWRVWWWTQYIKQEWFRYEACTWSAFLLHRLRINFDQFIESNSFFDRTFTFFKVLLNLLVIKMSIFFCIRSGLFFCKPIKSRKKWDIWIPWRDYFFMCTKHNVLIIKKVMRLYMWYTYKHWSSQNWSHRMRCRSVLIFEVANFDNISNLTPVRPFEELYIHMHRSSVSESRLVLDSFIDLHSKLMKKC